jgi:hypothetical protein
MITGFLLGLAALSLPIYAFAPDALTYFLRYHADRTPSRDSILFYLFRSPAMNPWFSHGFEAHATTLVTTIALAVSLVVLVELTRRGRLTPLAACALVTLAFMVTNKIYSPQYDLWLVPFLVMLPVRTKLVVHFYISSLAVWLLTAAAPNILPSPWRLYLVAVPVVYRLVVLAYLGRDFVACSERDRRAAEVHRVGLQH